MARLHSKTSRYAVLAVVLGIIVLFWYVVVQHQKRTLQRKEAFVESVDAVVTFVIPSVGRDTIDVPLQSLLDMKDPRWRAIVVYDGVTDKSPSIQDSRITVLRSEKKGNAGEVRNVGIRQATTEWIAFLDDDDAVSPFYIDRLLETVKSYPDVDTIVFRYKPVNYPQYRFGDVCPPRDVRDTLTKFRVGISFCTNRRVTQSILFQSISLAEDYQFLKDSLEGGFNKLLLSKFVTYGAGTTKEDLVKPDFWSNIDKDRCEESFITNIQ